MSIIMVDFKKHERIEALKDTLREEKAEKERRVESKAAWIGLIAGVVITTAIALGVNDYHRYDTDKYDVQYNHTSPVYPHVYKKQGSSDNQRPLLDVINITNSEIVASGNWAGYELIVTKPGAFKGVSTTFKVPEITGYKNKDIDVWTGLGGSPSEGLIQAGVAVYGSSVKPWIEELPKARTYLSGMQIEHGDILSISVSNLSSNGLSNSWNIRFVDINTGKSISEKVVYKAAVHSAECVVEKPWSNAYGKGYTLRGMPDFGTVKFGSCMPALTENGMDYADDTLSGTERSVKALFMELVRSDSRLATTITGMGSGGQFGVKYVNYGSFVPTGYKRKF
jgi:hypothetical protein